MSQLVLYFAEIDVLLGAYDLVSVLLGELVPAEVVLAELVLLWVDGS